MHSDFSTMAKSARAAIPAPAVPLGTIVSRSRALGSRDRLRAIVTCGALALAAVAGGTVGPKLYDGIQFWFSGDRWAVRVNSLTIASPPSANDLRAVTASATFPVVYPVGLPEGTHLIRILYSPADHPTSITLNYLNAGNQYAGTFTLIDSRIINATGFPDLGTGQVHYGVAKGLTNWRVGDETVIGGFDKGIPAASRRAIENAMGATSPAASLSATEAMLWKIRLLGGTYPLANVADRLAGDKGGVVIDRGNLRRIPGLARSHQPLLAPRTTYLTNIAYVDNKPQFNRATMRFDMAPTISPDGVRAVAAVMAAAGESGRWTDCCEVLYTPAANGSYAIWTLPMSKSQPIQKYAVDAQTYRARKI